MSALGTTNLTYADWAKRLEPDGGITTSIVEILNQLNEITVDATVVEANGPTSHRTTVRTGLPSGTWRKLYGGVQPTKSTTAQVTDTIGMLETYSEIDKALADLNGNTQAFRLSEELPFIEGLTQQLAGCIFTADEATNPERFTGLNARYGKSAATGIGKQVVLSGGTGSDYQSIWLICWSPNTIHLTFGKGGKAGLQRQDLGEQTKVVTADGSMYQVYRAHYRWDIGLTVRDYRYAVRVANCSPIKAIDGTDDYRPKLIKAKNMIYNPNMGNTVWYMSRTMLSALEGLLLTKSQYTFTYKDYQGKLGVPFLYGFPVKIVDQLDTTETVVS